MNTSTTNTNDEDSDSSTSSFTPLWIHPLATTTTSGRVGSDDNDNTNTNVKSGSYRVIQKLVTASPNPRLPEAEIETSLEAFVAPNNGDVLWRRVAVWSGPSSPQRVLHASFVLPKNHNNGCDANHFLEHQQQQLLCWTAFPERPHHKLLCVLVNPTTLSIWDVYPTISSDDDVYVNGGEGHSVSLPFQCCAIYTLGTRHGLLLQRQEDPEDWEAQQQQQNHQHHRDGDWMMASTPTAAADHDEDGFFLKVPPRNTRMMIMDDNNNNNNNSHHASATPRSTLLDTTTTEVASLFSLKHPLEDVLPVMTVATTMQNTNRHHQDQQLVTDAFEKILFTGVLRWTDHADDVLDKKQHEQPICVTYHSLRKRHAIWALKGAPVPLATPPLWKRSRHWRESLRDWDSHIGMLDQDFEDMELLGVAAHTNAYDHRPTRDEALADALGVRRTTPRRSTEASSSSRGAGGARSSRNNRGADNMSPLNNRSTYVQGPPPPRSVKDGSYLEGAAVADMSMVEATPQLLNLQPLSNLHPSVALECLYEEPNEGSPLPATNIFLASNLAGNGLLVLGIVVPSSSSPEKHNQGEENHKNLQLFQLDPTLDEPLAEQEMDSHILVGTLSESLRHTFSVKPLSAQPCIAATGVQTTPVPLRHLPHRKNRDDTEKQFNTEILILKKSANGGGTGLCLYRSESYILDCALPDGISEGHQGATHTMITNLRHSVNGSVDFVRGNDMEKSSSIRGNISLEIVSDALAEKVLVAIEDSMIRKGEEHSSSEPIEFALKLRADCCRLEQALNLDMSGLSSRLESIGWTAFESLFAHILNLELLGNVGEKGSISRGVLDHHGNSSPWATLLDSSFHASYFDDNCDALFLGSSGGGTYSGGRNALQTREDQLQQFLSSIGSHAIACLSSSFTPSVLSQLFDTLHLMYEDLKVSCDSNRADQLRAMGSPLVRTCHAAMAIAIETDPISSKLELFLSHYTRDLGAGYVESLQPRSNQAFHSVDKKSLPQLTSFDRPPCLLSWLDTIVKNADAKSFYHVDDITTINAACERTRSLFRIFSLLFCSEASSQLARDFEVVSALCEEGFTTAQEVRDELPMGVAVPLLEILNRCRDNPELGTHDSGWTAAEFNLVGRQDLSKNNGNAFPNVPLQIANKTVPVRVSDRDNPTFADKDKDGLVPLEVSSAMLFPEDNRIREAGRLLRSSRPCFLSVPRSVEVSDHDYERLKQNKLLLLCRRALALPIGRGMVTLGTFQPVAAEPLPVPDLCLVGRIPPTNTSLALDMSECQSDFKIWPEFHNGVAAGLRLPLGGDIKESISKITRTWIVYNRPTNAPPEPQTPNQGNQPPPAPTINSRAHGGLLLALGLRGHLAELEVTDIYDYLTQGSVPLTTGVLIGMAANKRGTCDISVSKMLCLHLPSLIPQHFSAIDVASPVQTAAVAGAGLLFQGSSHRMMTEFLLNEIGKRPESDVTMDREAYTLACGIALGMVNICKGERIHEGQTAGGGEGLADLRIGERLYRYIIGGTDDDEARRIREANDRLNLPPQSSSGENERCSCVFEGDAINIDVTAAGATLALGLIFLKSGNANIASSIALPDTHFLLEYVRPDFLALRVISKALILWDDVTPTYEWIEQQLPTVIRDAYKQMRSRIRKATDFTEDRRSSSGEASSRAQPQDYDCQAVRQIYVNVISGACFGLGLRFAGTADKQASAAIYERVVELQTLRDASDSVSVALRPEEQILDSCLGCCAISLALVNAGTGDLEVLKLFKILRWRCDEQVKYGTHQAFAMAIGLLFLGGGTCTLGREPEDIAALVAAFFPRFPVTTTDNQFHLQALRHLYALAVKRRELRFVDVDSGENVQIPIEIEGVGAGSDPLRLVAPCLLRNMDRPNLRARVVSDRFYPMQFDLSTSAFGRTFFVKRRIESPTVDGYTDSQRSLLLQTGNYSGGGFLELMKSLSGNPYIHAYAQYLCGNSNKADGKKKSRNGSSVEEFCASILYECLAGDVEMALPVYLGLRSSISSIEARSTSATRYSWDFRLIRSYYEEHCRRNSPGDRPLLNINKVALLNELAESSMVSSSEGCSQVLYDTT